MTQRYAKRFNRGSGKQSARQVAKLAKPLAPDNYSGLANNPQFGRIYEEQQNVPIDNSKALLRTLSPFTISVLPPLIFENVLQKDALRAVEDAGVGILNSFLGAVGNQVGSDGTPLSPGDLVLQAALAEWERGVREPRNGAANGRARINDYIQSAQGSGWTSLTYTHDEQKNADWCGHFAAFCYGAAGLSNEVKNKHLQSVSDMWNTYKDTPRILGSVGSDGLPVAPDPSVFQPGDLVMVGVPGGGLGPGNHITIVERVADKGVYTVEGNVEGKDLVSGERYEGVQRRFRPFNAPEGKYRVLWGMRPLPEDYDTPYYDDTGFLDAGLFSPIQSRLTSGTRQNPGIVDVALAKNKAFGEGKQARERATQELLNAALGGRGGGRISPAEFVAQGVAQAAEEGFSEPAFSDKLVAVDVLAQLEAILDTPPLTLLINPTSMSISYSDVQQFSQRTRKGYIFQRWGENKPKINISGTIGAYVAGQKSGTPPNGQTTSASGVQFASRRDSAAFQNLMNLLTIFKHNGYIYDRLGETNAHLFVGGIAIDYDKWTYIGNFDSFDYGEEEAKQNGGISFNMEFVVTQMYDNDSGKGRVRPMRSLGASVAQAISPESRISFNPVENPSIPSPPIVPVEEETQTTSGFAFATAATAGATAGSLLESDFVLTEEDFDEDGNLEDIAPLEDFSIIEDEDDPFEDP